MNQLLIRAGGGVIATAAAYGCFLLGGWDAAIRIMLLFMLLDYITGLLCGCLRKSPKTDGGGLLSSVAFLGLTRKLLMLAVVILAAGLDRLLGVRGLCRLAAIGFYTANEGLSIVENLALLGVPFPKGLARVLTVLRQRSDASAPGLSASGGAEEAHDGIPAQDAPDDASEDVPAGDALVRDAPEPRPTQNVPDEAPSDGAAQDTPVDPVGDDPARGVPDFRPAQDAPDDASEDVPA